MVGNYLFYLKYPLALPHLVLYHISDINVKSLISSDIYEMNRRCNLNKGLIYYLTSCREYRNLFYFRIKKARFFRILLPEYSNFIIRVKKSFGGHAFVLNHPYGTIINAKSIGSNFTICQLSTIGNGIHGRNDLIPTIGDNVSIGANVNIIGNVKIGNNVIIGAGSVVVKDVPNNCVIAGNPARIIRSIE